MGLRVSGFRLKFRVKYLQREERSSSMRRMISFCCLGCRMRNVSFPPLRLHRNISGRVLITVSIKQNTSTL